MQKVQYNSIPLTLLLLQVLVSVVVDAVQAAYTQTLHMQFKPKWTIIKDKDNMINHNFKKWIV